MNRRMISKERLAMLALTLMMTGATAFAQGNGMAGICLLYTSDAADEPRHV